MILATGKNSGRVPLDVGEPGCFMCPICHYRFAKSCTCTHDCRGKGDHRITWAPTCPAHPSGLT